jgi:hypothetical protein
MAIILLQRKSLKGGYLKGPHTKSFSTHVAIVSVTTAPCCIADSPFAQTHPSRDDFCREEAPYSNELSTFFALTLSDRVSFSLFSLIRLASLSVLIQVDVSHELQFEGNFSQNSGDGFVL